MPVCGSKGLSFIPRKLMLENNHPGYLNFSQLVKDNRPVIWTGIGKAEDLAWVESAVKEGVAPLLYWHFHMGNWPEATPLPVREALTRAYYTSLAQNTLLLLELAHLLALFAEVNIPVIVLKGGALADGYYDDIGLRPMGDLDLLLPEADIERALELIRARGYQPAGVEISQGVLRQLARHESWRGGPDGRLGVELHWHLIAGPADDRNVPVDWFWTQMEWRRGQSILSGIKIPHLKPTAHLLYLAAHLSLRHGGNYERLIWFYDADRLIRTGEVNWGQFIHQALVFGWGAPARYLIEGASVRFATSLPENVLGQLAQGEVWSSFLKERQAKLGDVSRTQQTWQTLIHLPLSVQVSWIVALIFPSPDYLQWRYQPNPSWTWPVYYLYRWVDIGKDVLSMVGDWWKRG